jgi:hypothetical protein
VARRLRQTAPAFTSAKHPPAGDFSIGRAVGSGARRAQTAKPPATWASPHIRAASMPPHKKRSPKKPKVLESRFLPGALTHTAFDKVALHQARTKCQAPPLTCTWLDSACVARRTFKEFSKSGYGLLNVCEAIGYKYRPHDALEDAKAAGQIMLAAMAQSGLDLNGWLTRVRQPIDPSLERIARNGNPKGELCG